MTGAGSAVEGAAEGEEGAGGEGGDGEGGGVKTGGVVKTHQGGSTHSDTSTGGASVMKDAGAVVAGACGDLTEFIPEDGNFDRCTM